MNVEKMPDGLYGREDGCFHSLKKKEKGLKVSKDITTLGNFAWNKRYSEKTLKTVSRSPSFPYP